MNFPRAEYDALTAAVGLVELCDWTQIELTGADRLKFLNNFCTADLRKLSAGQGAEAFICHVKGKVLGHVFIVQEHDRLILVTVPRQAETLIPHLDRYTLSDDVALRDVSSETRLLQIAGDTAAATLERLMPGKRNLPQQWLETTPCTFADGAAANVTGGILGASSFLLRTPVDHTPELLTQLQSAGVILCDAAAFDAIRIENGLPLYGRDITADNLPQEVNRNAQAISFTKGCYLGQETVARIDALGHVNRVLVSVRFDGEQIPAAGDELSVDGKAVGHVTSAAFSPRLGKAIALAYVRTASAAPGNCLQSPVGGAHVVG